MESLKNLLPRSLVKTKAQRQLHASVVVSAARKVITAAMGEAAGEKIHIVSLRDKALKVVCDDAVLAQEMALAAPSLIAAINEKMAGDEVSRIVATC